ncbi:DUF2235 domain-containing protein [uncultured Phycicoccus sp.]|uniref:DUF2235 domain-containing protein n=1 Tax=uncultured Phycicoccus sp. TaxID=661422 RepID=UPI002610E867|nr:DUF2235 domain-containing protein [uncultured Phycicoccus sp.]
MKRLVVCCDGTWNKPDSRMITNVEKLARTVQTDPGATGGAYQLVYYVSGVGAGSYAADRLLGGAFGFGLFHNVIACYRFLAQNYEPGDAIYIFGFSRGAYTARSVAGMLGRVGLLTKTSLVEERLPTAVRMYQRTELPEGAFGASVEEFKHDHCHPADVQFLGVFDTVGALGVPGLNRLAPQFHDVQLGDTVRRARHALALDETRLKFEPTFWEARDQPDGTVTEDARVKQVWFEGAHSDVGGGYRETGLSDTALLWMAREAHDAGLVFDVPLLSRYVHSGSDPIRHNPLTRMYQVHNAVLAARARVSATHQAATFSQGRRRLTNERALSVRVASSAVNHFQGGGYEPSNLAAFAEATDGFTDVIEPVTALPERGVDLTDLAGPTDAGRPDQT